MQLLLRPWPSPRPGVASARRLRTRNAEAPPEGPPLQGIRVDAAFRVGMPCAREGRSPIENPKMKNGIWAGAQRRPFASPGDRLKGHPQERQHSAPPSAKSGTECPRRGVPYRVRDGSPQGRRRAARLRSRGLDSKFVVCSHRHMEQHCRKCRWDGRSSCQQRGRRPDLAFG